MDRLTQTSDKGGVALTFDLDITCKPSEAQKILRLAEKLKQYEDLGTVEELQHAMEKQTAVSRVVIEGQYFCPKCKSLMKYPGYCGCGQKLY